jgi:hypothetical protein
LQSEQRARPVNPRPSHSLAPSRSPRQRPEQHTRTRATAAAAATGRYDRSIPPLPRPPTSVLPGLRSCRKHHGDESTRRLEAGRPCGFPASPGLSSREQAACGPRRRWAFSVCKMQIRSGLDLVRPNFPLLAVQVVAGTGSTACVRCSEFRPPSTWLGPSSWARTPCCHVMQRRGRVPAMHTLSDERCPLAVIHAGAGAWVQT